MFVDSWFFDRRKNVYNLRTESSDVEFENMVHSEFGAVFLQEATSGGDLPHYAPPSTSRLGFHHPRLNLFQQRDLLVDFSVGQT
jgi:hypothetical protein